MLNDIEAIARLTVFFIFLFLAIISALFTITYLAAAISDYLKWLDGEKTDWAIAIFQAGGFGFLLAISTALAIKVKPKRWK